MNPIKNVVCDVNSHKKFKIEDLKDFGSIDRDPLDGLGEWNEEKFYKLDQVVYAEPVETINDCLSSDRVDDSALKWTFFDKVTVEKRVGKRNKYHIEIEDASKPVCPKTNCDKNFSSMTLLKAHIRKVHCAEQSFTCELCGLSFTAKYLLRRHMAVHEKTKVQCPVCCKQLSKRTNLSVHLRFVHSQGQLKCDKCDQIFERRSQYVRHISTHTK